ncbi:unnamed protein product [Vitrella brassicaformis CCMP3155]|uniref:Sfi1 spindle body domain-containing protein n=4 Tax=Vitrella brassicaformis TaxID=1169539 RepID=A0A0G4G8P8_VITBC|nr:unnamed protein product [Vitrella brassicaformis CCMP3155]|eukprot:CEM24757.1 unnamed protein product [Vitrella brassicaformis CCMP3155]
MHAHGHDEQVTLFRLLEAYDRVLQRAAIHPQGEQGIRLYRILLRWARQPERDWATHYHADFPHQPPIVVQRHQEPSHPRRPPPPAPPPALSPRVYPPPLRPYHSMSLSASHPVSRPPLTRNRSASPMVGQLVRQVAPVAPLTTLTPTAPPHAVHGGRPLAADLVDRAPEERERENALANGQADAFRREQLLLRSLGSWRGHHASTLALRHRLQSARQHRSHTLIYCAMKAWACHTVAKGARRRRAEEAARKLHVVHAKGRLRQWHRWSSVRHSRGERLQGIVRMDGTLMLRRYFRLWRRAYRSQRVRQMAWLRSCFAEWRFVAAQMRAIRSVQQPFTRILTLKRMRTALHTLRTNTASRRRADLLLVKAHTHFRRRVLAQAVRVLGGHRERRAVRASERRREDERVRRWRLGRATTRWKRCVASHRAMMSRYAAISRRRSHRELRQCFIVWVVGYHRPHVARRRRHAAMVRQLAAMRLRRRWEAWRTEFCYRVHMEATVLRAERRRLSRLALRALETHVSYRKWTKAAHKAASLLCQRNRCLMVLNAWRLIVAESRAVTPLTSRTQTWAAIRWIHHTQHKLPSPANATSERHAKRLSLGDYVGNHGCALAMVPACMGVHVGRLKRMVRDGMEHVVRQSVLSHVLSRWRASTRAVRAFKRAATHRYVRRTLLAMHTLTQRRRMARYVYSVRAMQVAHRMQHECFEQWRQRWEYFTHFRDRVRAFRAHVAARTVRGCFMGWRVVVVRKEALRIKETMMVNRCAHRIMRATLHHMIRAFRVSQRERALVETARLFRRRSYLRRALTALTALLRSARHEGHLDEVAGAVRLVMALRHWHHAARTRRRYRLAREAFRRRLQRRAVCTALIRWAHMAAKHRRHTTLVLYSVSRCRSRCLMDALTTWQHLYRRRRVLRVLEAQADTFHKRWYMHRVWCLWRRRVEISHRLVAIHRLLQGAFSREAINTWADWTTAAEQHEVRIHGVLLVRRFRMLIHKWHTIARLPAIQAQATAATRAIRMQEGFTRLHTAARAHRAARGASHRLQTWAHRYRMRLFFDTLVYWRSYRQRCRANAIAIAQSRDRKEAGRAMEAWRHRWEQKRRLRALLSRYVGERRAHRQRDAMRKWRFRVRVLGALRRCAERRRRNGLALCVSAWGGVVAERRDERARRRRIEGLVANRRLADTWDEWRSRFLNARRVRLAIAASDARRRRTLLHTAIHTWHTIASRRRLTAARGAMVASIHAQRRLCCSFAQWVGAARTLVAWRQAAHRLSRLWRGARLRRAIVTWAHEEKYIGLLQSAEHRLLAEYCRRLQRRALQAWTTHVTIRHSKRAANIQADAVAARFAVRRHLIAWLSCLADRISARQRQSHFDDRSRGYLLRRVLREWRGATITAKERRSLTDLLRRFLRQQSLKSAIHCLKRNRDTKQTFRMHIQRAMTPIPLSLPMVPPPTAPPGKDKGDRAAITVSAASTSALTKDSTHDDRERDKEGEDQQHHQQQGQVVRGRRVVKPGGSDELLERLANTRRLRWAFAAIRAWWSLVREENGRLATLGDSLGKFHRFRVQGGTFYGWLQQTLTSRQRGHTIRRRHDEGRLRRALYGWCGVRRDEREREGAADQMRERLLDQAAVRIMFTWRAAARHRIVLREASHVIACRHHALLRRWVWLLWREATLFAIMERQASQRHMFTLQGHILHSWRDAATRLRALRHTREVFDRRRLGRMFSLWRAMHMRRVRERRDCRCIVGRWRIWARMRRTKRFLLTHLLTDRRLVTVTQSFRAWYHLALLFRQRRYFQDRILSRPLEASFNAWRAHMRHIQLSRHAVIQTSHCKASKRLQRTAFHAWRLHTHLSAFVRRHAHRRMSELFAVWRRTHVLGTRLSRAVGGQQSRIKAWAWDAMRRWAQRRAERMRRNALAAHRCALRRRRQAWVLWRREYDLRHMEYRIRANTRRRTLANILRSWHSWSLSRICARLAGHQVARKHNHLLARHSFTAWKRRTGTRLVIRSRIRSRIDARQCHLLREALQHWLRGVLGVRWAETMQRWDEGVRLMLVARGMAQLRDLVAMDVHMQHLAQRAPWLRQQMGELLRIDQRRLADALHALRTRAFRAALCRSLTSRASDHYTRLAPSRAICRWHQRTDVRRRRRQLSACLVRISGEAWLRRVVCEWRGASIRLRGVRDGVERRRQEKQQVVMRGVLAHWRERIRHFTVGRRLMEKQLRVCAHWSMAHGFHRWRRSLEVATQRRQVARKAQTAAIRIIRIKQQRALEHARAFVCLRHAAKSMLLRASHQRTKALLTAWRRATTVRRRRADIGATAARQCAARRVRGVWRAWREQFVHMQRLASLADNMRAQREAKELGGVLEVWGRWASARREERDRLGAIAAHVRARQVVSSVSKIFLTWRQRAEEVLWHRRRSRMLLVFSSWKMYTREKKLLRKYLHDTINNSSSSASSLHSPSRMLYNVTPTPRPSARDREGDTWRSPLALPSAGTPRLAFRRLSPDAQQGMSVVTSDPASSYRRSPVASPTPPVAALPPPSHAFAALASAVRMPPPANRTPPPLPHGPSPPGSTASNLWRSELSSPVPPSPRIHALPAPTPRTSTPLPIHGHLRVREGPPPLLSSSSPEPLVRSSELSASLALLKRLEAQKKEGAVAEEHTPPLVKMLLNKGRDGHTRAKSAKGSPLQEGEGGGVDVGVAVASPAARSPWSDPGLPQRIAGHLD